MQKNIVLRYISLILVDILAVVAAIAVFLRLRDSYWFLRIEGDPMKTAMTWALIVGAVVVVVAVNILILQSVAHIKEQQAGNTVQDADYIREKLLGGQEEDELTAEEFSKLFLHIRENKPKLADLMDEALKQLATFYEDCETLQKVMKIKRLDYDIVTDTVDKSERLVLENMRSFVPELIIWNPKHSDLEERQDTYRQLRSSIEQKLMDNRQNLSTFHQLLMSVRQINDKGVQKDHELEALITALDYKYGSH